MNPEDMSIEQLTEEIRKEIGKRADQDFVTDQSMKPVRVRPVSREEGVSEEIAWGLVATTTVALVIVCIVWLL